MSGGGGGAIAHLFPGQGAHEPAMLDAVADRPSFGERFAVVRDALGFDPREDLAGQIDRNRVSSLLTVLVSRVLLDGLEAEGASPRAVAGYSVGQWMAMHAAGVLGFEDLARVLVKRCDLMDACAERRPGGMVAVIGLSEEKVERACEGLEAEVVNYNCVGQYTIAAAEAAIEPVMAALSEHKPKRLARLPVAGPWHSSLLREAEGPFGEFLDTLTLREPRVPVIDNTTGDWLPSQPRANLVRHISSPVRWEAGVRTLIGFGCDELVEVGYGDVLSRFGFFIDRGVTHRALRPPPR